MTGGSLAALAEKLPEIWTSTLLGKVSNANIKLIRMGGEGIPEEYHKDFNELLVVIAGEMTLIVDGKTANLTTGDFYLIEKNAKHRVPAGSYGTLLLIDAE